MTTEASDAGTAAPNAGDSTQTTADLTKGQETAATELKAEEGASNANPEAKDEGATDNGTKPDEPIVYDFKAPEGVELDSTAVDEFKAVAAELKLPAESAQKVVDLYAKLQQQRADAFAAQVETWGEQVRADKELGGTKLDETLATARKTVDTFGTPKFKALLNSTGMGNHPEVVRMMAKIGKAISEDTIVRGNTSASPKDHASILYGNPTT